MGSTPGYSTNTRSGLAHFQAEERPGDFRLEGVAQAQARLDAADALATTPDLTDDAVKKAKLAAQQKLLTGQGFGQMFLTGPLGLTGSAGVAAGAKAKP